MVTAAGGTLNEWGWFVVVVPCLVALLVLVMLIWQWRMGIERQRESQRRAEARNRWAVSNRRLSKLHVIQSDPGAVRPIPKENP